LSNFHLIFEFSPRITRYATCNHQFVTTVGAGPISGFINERVQAVVVAASGWAFSKHVTTYG
jgi:hypothetical protein